MKGLVMSLAVLFAPLAAGELPSETSVKPVKIVEVPGYCEGVVFDRGGHAYISDTQNGTVYRVTPDGSATVWAKTGAPNGHKICPTAPSTLRRQPTRGPSSRRRWEVLDKASSECNGNPACPQRSVVGPEGGFYFTDPAAPATKNPIGTVHYVDPQGKRTWLQRDLPSQRGRSASGRQKPSSSRERLHRVLIYDVLSPGKVVP